VVARREQQHDSLGLQTARGEGQRVGGRFVEPLCVVDQAEHRLLLRHLREHAENGDRHEETVLPVGRVLQPEGGAQGGPLPDRDGVDVLTHRPQKLVHGGERELRLGLDAGAAQDPQPVGTVGGVRQQGGFADARLAAQHQCAAASRAGGGEQPVDLLALAPPAVQHPPIVRKCDSRRYR
jgi:hypothetical protein